MGRNGTGNMEANQNVDFERTHLLCKKEKDQCNSDNFLFDTYASDRKGVLN